ncbi:hypothetical protein [Streptomyces sp. NPDC053720]|uniref:hypothetical protein n=1 Tax=Streptomyces sp. NPDC053720 TaxID=3154855 RepID=UPI0034184F99
MPPGLHTTEAGVDVPIHDGADPALRGWHVFTSVADSPATALRRAHEVYDTALAAHTAGRDNPGKQPPSSSAATASSWSSRSAPLIPLSSLHQDPGGGQLMNPQELPR